MVTLDRYWVLTDTQNPDIAIKKSWICASLVKISKVTMTTECVGTAVDVISKMSKHSVDQISAEVSKKIN